MAGRGWQVVPAAERTGGTGPPTFARAAKAAIIVPAGVAVVLAPVSRTANLDAGCCCCHRRRHADRRGRLQPEECHIIGGAESSDDIGIHADRHDSTHIPPPPGNDRRHHTADPGTDRSAYDDSCPDDAARRVRLRYQDHPEVLDP